MGHVTGQKHCRMARVSVVLPLNHKLAYEYFGDIWIIYGLYWLFKLKLFKYHRLKGKGGTAEQHTIL